jgi:hypothetical protein
VKTFVWYFALAAVLSPASLSAQNAPAAPSQSDQLATSIARARSGNVDTSDVEIIAEAGAVQAISSLEEQFGRTTDVGTKTKIANGLVGLGDKHNTYWNYLLEQATLAVDSDVPDALFSDPLGKTVDQISSELQAWLKPKMSPRTLRLSPRCMICRAKCSSWPRRAIRAEFRFCGGPSNPAIT